MNIINDIRKERDLLNFNDIVFLMNVSELSLQRNFMIISFVMIIIIILVLLILKKFIYIDFIQEDKKKVDGIKFF